MATKPTFNEACYELLRTVPAGRVTTYQEIARALGTKAFRAVGNAMNRNPYAPEVPCHRVVCSDGRLGGFAFGSRAKIDLLTKEGVLTRAGRVQNFSEVFFPLRKPRTKSS